MARTSLINAMLSSALVIGVALFAVSEAADVVPSKCPENLLQNETVQIPHESDCTKYYTCTGNTKVLRECPFMDSERNRLFFNPKLHLCDWPWQAGCDLPLPIRTIEKTSYKRKPIPTKCPRVDSKNETVCLAHETDCTKFYACLQGKNVLMSCPTDRDGNKLYFNPSAQVCDWPYNVDCYSQNELERVSIELSTLNSDYPTKCPKVDPQNETIVLPHETDCTKFYLCSSGNKYVMECPVVRENGVKLVFNPKIHECDFPENSECDKDKNWKMLEPKMRAPPSTTQVPVPIECPAFDPPYSHVLIADEYDCTKYYICMSGIKIEKRCPKFGDTDNRLFFNKDKQACVAPWTSGCVPKITTPGSTWPTRTTSTPTWPTSSEPTPTIPSPTKKPAPKIWTPIRPTAPKPTPTKPAPTNPPPTPPNISPTILTQYRLIMALNLTRVDYIKKDNSTV